MSAFLDMTPVATLGPGSTRVLLAIFLCLAAATVLRGLSLWRQRDERARRRWHSLLSWWGLFLLFVVLVALGRSAVVVLLAAISVIAVAEGLRLTGKPGLLPAAGAVVVALFVWAWLDWHALFIRVLPALAVAGLAVEMAWRGWLRPRLSGPRNAILGTIPAVVGPLFAVGVASLPPPAGPSDERLGWFVLLILLTGLNDMAQAWWGRALGSRQMAPRLSPRKTWTGLVGGLATTAAVAVVVAPLVTGYGRALPAGAAIPGSRLAWPAAVGLLVGLAGVLGDLAVSALKRRAGVKDSGDLLPGQGGILDRIDSLAATAPAYFVVTRLLWFHQP